MTDHIILNVGRSVPAQGSSIDSMVSSPQFLPPT